MFIHVLYQNIFQNHLGAITTLYVVGYSASLCFLSLAVVIMLYFKYVSIQNFLILPILL